MALLSRAVKGRAWAIGSVHVKREDTPRTSALSAATGAMAKLMRPGEGG